MVACVPPAASLEKRLRAAFYDRGVGREEGKGAAWLTQKTKFFSSKTFLKDPNLLHLFFFSNIFEFDYPSSYKNSLI